MLGAAVCWFNRRYRESLETGRTESLSTRTAIERPQFGDGQYYSRPAAATDQQPLNSGQGPAVMRTLWQPYRA
jgi:hypothetical protein